jgi:hypothetical protein
MTTEPRVHPFVPVVRWMIFPFVSGLAGMLGGGLAWAAGWRPCSLPELALSYGLLSVGGAAGCCLTSRAWPAVALTPALLMAVLLGAVPSYYKVVNPAMGLTPASYVRDMLADPRFFLPMFVYSTAQASGHVLAIRWGGSLFRRACFYAAAGAAAGTAGLLLVSEWERFGTVVVATLLQAPVMQAALAVSARLRRSAPATGA